MTNIPVQWGRRVRRIAHDDDGVSVYFEDGSSAKGDILVGADGINSVGKSNHSLHSPRSVVISSGQLG
jgi:2-polyprenyl-6-methoxyphenol hydroxylase-like FAD-dependent oxidoreductase